MAPKCLWKAWQLPASTVFSTKLELRHPVKWYFIQSSLILFHFMGETVKTCILKLIITSDYWVGCPPKLVSFLYYQRHYPKQDFCFGCFASLSKQRLSVFRYNRNINRWAKNNSVRKKNRKKLKDFSKIHSHLYLEFLFAFQTRAHFVCSETMK